MRIIRTNHYVDMHSHILPAMDDGSRSMEMSMNMMRIAWDEGIRTIIVTPHNMPGKGYASLDRIMEGIEALGREAHKENIDIVLKPGSELYYREEISNLIEQGSAVAMNHTKHVLVEFEPVNDARNIINALKKIIGIGYTPIVAHIERYPALFDKKLEQIETISNMGCYIQVNASTIIGRMGFGMRMNIKKLLKEQLIDFIGTDAHSDHNRAPRMAECADYLYKKCDAAYADSMLFGLAEDILLKNER